MRWSLTSVLVALISIKDAQSDTDCGSFNDCASCTTPLALHLFDKEWKECSWLNEECVSHSAADDAIDFDDQCPYPSEDIPTDSNTWFLADWFDHMGPTIDHLTLLDLSLPGTHDTLTYDLSTELSDGEVPEVLRKYEQFYGINDFIRWEAICQYLNITSQLDNGIRFLDFRMMFEDDLQDWYSEHTLQSVHSSLTYLREIRGWLDAHPKEILVIWTSKHGNTCDKGDDQYPNVSISVKQEWWGNITQVFDGLLVNFDETQINSTTIGEMKDRNQRVVIYATDYEEMTGSSNLALDACLIDNQLGTQAYKDEGEFMQSIFNGSQARIAEDKKEQGLFLYSMVGSATDEQIAVAALNRFSGLSLPCVKAIDPLATTWCPETLHDLAQLENYYTQRLLDQALEDDVGFPNAIYINGVDWDGTIRTGTKLPWGTRKSDDEDHQTTRFAYVATLLAWNLRLGCSADRGLLPECRVLKTSLDAMRQTYPVQRWNDEYTGRHWEWPAPQ